MPARAPMLAAAATLVALASLPGRAQSQTVSMKQVMLDLIHPASNEILLIVTRGGPASEKDWASLRHSALTLQESTRTLIQTGPNADLWSTAANQLSAAAFDVYRAALARDAKSLPALTMRIDAACTNCHRQYRPNVFPPPAGRVE